MTRSDLVVESTTVGNLVGTIEYDTDPESPREWDNLGIMLTAHRNYAFGRKNDRDGRREDLSREAFEEEAKQGGYVYLPIYLFDHSGVALQTTPFSDPWDSGLLGWIYATPSAIRENFNVTRITKNIRELTLGVLKGEIEDLNLYASGQVYAYTITDTDGDIVDSCSGFYGLEHIRSELQAQLKSLAKSIAA